MNRNYKSRNCNILHAGSPQHLLWQFATLAQSDSHGILGIYRVDISRERALVRFGAVTLGRCCNTFQASASEWMALH